MPYVLDVPRYRPGCLSWSDTPQTPASSAQDILLNRMGGETVAPIPFVQAQDDADRGALPATALCDIFPGRWAGSLFVSQRFRTVVTRMDPVAHIYQPVDLTMVDGTRYSSGFYALRIADRVTAIDAGNSQLVAKFLDGTTVRSLETQGVGDIFAKGETLGRFLYFGAATGDPVIRWHEDCLAGRHLWMDKDYPAAAFISDDLAQAFEDAGITGLDLGRAGRGRSGRDRDQGPCLDAGEPRADARR